MEHDADTEHLMIEQRFARLEAMVERLTKQVREHNHQIVANTTGPALFKLGYNHRQSDLYGRDLL